MFEPRTTSTFPLVAPSLPPKFNMNGRGGLGLKRGTGGVEIVDFIYGNIFIQSAFLGNVGDCVKMQKKAGWTCGATKNRDKLYSDLFM